MYIKHTNLLGRSFDKTYQLFFYRQNKGKSKKVVIFAA